MTPAALDAHVRSLAREIDHNVVIDPDFMWWPPVGEYPDLDAQGVRGGACIHSSRDIVLGQPIRNEFTYGVAMHELGHAYTIPAFPDWLRDTLAFQTRNVVTLGLYQQEAAAWLWACRHALVWTALSASNAAWSLRYYRQHLRRTCQ